MTAVEKRREGIRPPPQKYTHRETSVKIAIYLEIARESEGTSNLHLLNPIPPCHPPTGHGADAPDFFKRGQFPAMNGMERNKTLLLFFP